ncbi:MAG: glycosyltransferase family 4 protein, partial [Myxococcales bacterium]|nr:glycosyltransferase family 4 protein [Myxococcales bacterium]
VGGDARERARGVARSRALGIEARCHWLPPEPLESLGPLMSEAAILAAPRLRGINTPMKIFPFLHSGKPVLLTRLPTHTQLLDDRTAFLVEPDAPSVAAGLLRLVRDPDLRNRLGEAGVAFVEANHTYAAHRERLRAAYLSIAEVLAENSKLEASC